MTCCKHVKQHKLPPWQQVDVSGLKLWCVWCRRTHAQVCCWEDDEMSEPPTPTLKHVKSDAAVEISSRRSTAATTEATEAVSTVRRPAAAAPATLAVAPTAVSPVLAPVEGHTLTSSSPRRLTGSTPATIRTV